MAAQFGRRLRRGATTTAVAAAAVAALSASQAPGITHADFGGGDATGNGAPDTASDSETSATGDSPYYTDLPTLRTPNGPNASINLPATTGSAESGIPATVLTAYKEAERTIQASDPACRVPWQLLAGIGKVESGQARGGKVDANGTTFSPILGPVLNGVGFANISDTDNGEFDGDTTHDRAVGPMQFIPSTWATWGQDANGDGVKNPNNIHDAALAAGRYLCAGDRDLTKKHDLDQAILSYNRSREYLNTVLSWFEFYKRGTHQVPDGEGVLPDTSTPDSPPAGPQGATPPKTKPPTSAKPKPPAKPGKPSKPTTPPTKPPTKPPVTPPTPPPATSVEVEGAAELTTMAGRDFAHRPAVRAEDSKGRGVSKQEIRFEIIGATEARFPGGKTSAVVLTGADGKAIAPVLKAGEKTGSFKVRATAVGRGLPSVNFAAKVTARAADNLVRVNDKPLIAAPGTEFADFVEVKAAYQNAVAAGVEITAALITDTANPVENDKGPSFGKDADGKIIRTLTGLKTDADGVLRLPKLFAGDELGTFRLQLTAVGGVSINIALTVEAPPAPETPAG
ncbi:lytic transglycosylase domain-containing protein [Streptomyces sp. CAU 1734]|uniref:lytic transglycosylase domain-containing protein n=1 Tax=Streptomyces sp. CAU 1734 TaxID=3140360 RepID=UPI003261A8EA